MNAPDDHAIPAPADIPTAALSDSPTPADSGGEGTQAELKPPTHLFFSEGVPVVPGYMVTHEIARGGMGAVYAAYDPVFDREVAIKVMHFGQDASRFVTESKVTARLPHPGVPPVYALGELPDGRPFLTMKFIQGRTLADELKAAERADLPRILSDFERVCQTVGFAHAQGVIHRDLKPANLMVGAFGEVLVMDWGLAKTGATGRGKSADEGDARTSHQPAHAGWSPEFTQAGQVKGTPAFMAPEQARGEPVDARADVFALGGVLCAILTGKAPFLGDTLLATVRKAAAGELADAFGRLDGCGAAVELVALCKQCMNPLAWRRPADGKAVADAMAAYRAGHEERTQQAEMDRASARARADEADARAKAEARARAAAEARAEAEAARTKEQRKRRRTQVGLVAAVAALLIGGIGFAWSEDRRVGRARVGAERVLAQLPELYRRGHWGQAEALLSQATLAGADADAGLKARLAQASGELAVLMRLDRIRTDKAIASNGGWDEQGVKGYEPVFRERGYDFADADPAGPPRLAERLRYDPLREYLLVALDDWLPAESDERVVANITAVTVAATGEPWRAKLRGGPEAALMIHNGQLVVPWDEVSAPAVASLGLLLIKFAPGSKDRALAKMEEALQRYPSDFWLHLYIGQERFKRGEIEAAVGAFRAAVAVRPEAQGAKKLLADALAARK